MANESRLVILSRSEESGRGGGKNERKTNVAKHNMKEEREYYVYIMSNWSRTLYIGVTSDLIARVDQHKKKANPGSFTARYNVTDLVYYESTNDVGAAIWREKQLKGWRRARKIALIESVNSEWRDLSLDWAEPHHPQTLRCGSG